MIQLFKEASTNGVSQRDLQALLKSRDLYVLYNHLLQRSSDPAMARKLLQIILTSTRPLTLDEINPALNVLPSHFSMTEVGSALKYPCENYIKSLCVHFILIIRSEVCLVHQTAREFLLQQPHVPKFDPLQPPGTRNLERNPPGRTWEHSLSMCDS